MKWLGSLLLFFVLSATNTLVQRRYSSGSKLPSTLAPATSYVIGVMPMGILAASILGGFRISWSPLVIFLLLTEGVFIGLFNWLAFSAFSRLSASRGQIIFQVYALVSLLGGLLFLGERLSCKQLLGLAVVVTSVLLIARSLGPKEEKDKDVKSVILMLLAGTCLGGGLVAEKAALGYMSMSAYFIFGYAAQTASLAVIALKDWRHIKKIRKSDIKIMGYMGVLSALIGFTYIYALVETNNIGLVSVLSSFQLPVTVLAGILILKEKNNLSRVVLCCALGTVGLILAATR